MIERVIYINHQNKIYFSAKYFRVIIDTLHRFDIYTVYHLFKLINDDYNINDIMIKNKPYIIFIPDSEDKNIDNIYNEAYCNIIKRLKNGTMNFRNRFFDVKSTVNKIIICIIKSNRSNA